jgi:hypothetical protein
MFLPEEQQLSIILVLFVTVPAVLRLCYSFQGSFVCKCYVGFVMSSDQRTCVPCANGRYGVDCQQTCSCNGRHSACSPYTGCVCLAGWSGTHCENDVNECVTLFNACGTGKLCVNNNGSYACVCPSGYSLTAAGVCQGMALTYQYGSLSAGVCQGMALTYQYGSLSFK